jgi:hypothetical protein
MPPNATGTVFAIRHMMAAKRGSNPIPASKLAGIATAVPKPAAASKKPPKEMRELMLVSFYQEIF